jgi:twitching motility protein PilT
MPFVDINSIAPKVSGSTANPQPTPAVVTPIGSPTDVREVKGPQFTDLPVVKEAPQPVAQAIVAPVEPEPLDIMEAAPEVEKPLEVKPIDYSLASPTVSAVEPAAEMPQPVAVLTNPAQVVPSVAATPPLPLEPLAPATQVVQEADVLRLPDDFMTQMQPPAVPEVTEALSSAAAPVVSTPLPSPVAIPVAQVPELPGAEPKAEALPEVKPSEPKVVEPKLEPAISEPEVKANELPELDVSKLVKIGNDSLTPAAESDDPMQIEEEIKPTVSNVTQNQPIAKNDTQAKAALKNENLVSREMLLDEYLKMAVEMGASDVHFTVGYRVFVRVNGGLKTLPTPILEAADTAKFAKQMYAYKGIKDTAGLKDYDMAYELSTKHRFRVNVFTQRSSQALVFRLISSEIQTIDSLHMPAIVLDFAKLSYGLVLVTGPTGSGKSTTLAAIINYINQTQAKHIITIEDPVEYIYPRGKSLIDQRELLQDTDSWGVALKSVLRQDPNVVLVGEMRDYDTIASAIRVAETGHLVFATLHTNTAAQTIERIIDVFPEHQQSQIRVQLAGTLQAVISQRLIPTNDGKSRRPAFEILVANDAVKASIRDNKTHQIDNIIQTGADVGMVTLEKSLVNLIREGVITTERAQEFTNRPDEILALLSKA